MAKARSVYWALLGLAGLVLFAGATRFALLHYAASSIVALSPGDRVARERCSIDDFAETCKRLIPPKSLVVNLTSSRGIDDVRMKYAMYPIDLKPNAISIFQGNDSTDRLRQAILDSGVDFFVHLDTKRDSFPERLQACDITEVVVEQCGRRLLRVKRAP